MTETLIKDPIYFQATERLRQLLRESKDYVPGSQFLTERQVAERFGISRATANKSLASLVSEGLLEFRKGVGTFVRPAPTPTLDYDLRSLVSFTEKARAAGKVPTTTVLDLESVAPSDDFAPGEPLWSLTRLRLADGVPLIYEKRLLVKRLCPDLTRELAAGSLYAYINDVLKLAVAGADETISAVSAKKREAKLLQIEPGAACLCVTATATLIDGAPLWWERTLYRGDAYALRNRLGPITHAAVGVLK